MKEFGSDFQYIKPEDSFQNTIFKYYPYANYYADGRQALIHLYHSQGWKRLWIPEYFCYDVINSLKQFGLNICLYVDYPGCNDENNTLENINSNGKFLKTDAVLKVNYFGTRSFRKNEKLPVAAIVEDHTHDLIGNWAKNSNADFCIASLRKTLPLPEGGILWSPIGLQLPETPQVSIDNEEIANIRWEAMKLKAKYLAGENVEKAVFRSWFVNTEDFFDKAEVCSLDKMSLDYLSKFNIHNWYEKKRKNWELLCYIEKEGVKVIYPGNMGCYPFSLILLFDSQKERDRVRKEFIAHNIYPAVLWNIPSPNDGNIFKFSKGMLSIHCDGRYTTEDIRDMKSIIESIL